MLFVRGLVVAAGGIAFVFLPGVVVSYLTRRDLRFETGLLLWGMGLLIVALFPALFLSSLVVMIAAGSREPDLLGRYAIVLMTVCLSALFLETGKYLLLRWRNIPAPKLLDSGIMVGLGVGLVTNVFQGISLVGAGFHLLLGDASQPDLAQIAAQPWPNLLIGQIALIVYRLGLVAISAALGAVVARALIRSEHRWVWVAIGINALTAFVYNAIGQALGSDTLVGSLVAIAYEGILAAAAMRWLVQEINRPLARQVERAAGATRTP